MAELTLEVVEGPDAGRKVGVSGDMEIGRQPDLAFTVQDQLVSRKHARISPSEGGVVVEDLGSRNGTFVNGNQIHSPTLVTPGDQILVGVTVLQLRTAQQLSDQPSAVREVPPGLAASVQRPTYLPEDLGGAAPTGPQLPAGQAPPGGGPPAAQGPPAPVGRPPEIPVPELDPLLDVYTKRRALIAPLAISVLVVFVVLIWLAARG